MNANALSHVYLRANARHPAELRPLGQDPEDFTVTTVYNIIGGESERTLGHLESQHVKFGAALNEGESFFDVADSHSQDLCDIHGLMYNPDTGWHADAFEKIMGATACSTDICYIPTDEIFDHAWGRKALHVLCQHNSCAVGHIVVGVSDLMRPVSAKEYVRALGRVAALQCMGFVHYVGTPYLFLNMELRQSTFEESEAAMREAPKLQLKQSRKQKQKPELATV